MNPLWFQNYTTVDYGTGEAAQKSDIKKSNMLVIKHGPNICKRREDVTNKSEDCQQGEYVCTKSSQAKLRMKQMFFMNF